MTETMSTGYPTTTRKWCGRDAVERWNRLYPAGTAVGICRRDGSVFETRTRGEAKVFQDAEGRLLAAIYVNGFDSPVTLADCRPEIPNELRFLTEVKPAEENRKSVERIRADLDLESDFFRLAKHWELRADKAGEDEDRVLRQCAKQLRQRGQWLRDDLVVLREMLRAAPHLLP